jgi:hypothetical protein
VRVQYKKYQPTQIHPSSAGNQILLMYKRYHGVLVFIRFLVGIKFSIEKNFEQKQVIMPCIRAKTTGQLMEFIPGPNIKNKTT